MKTLTENFRKYFENFDFNDQNYNTLHALVDIILEMLSITDYEGEKIKKLSSFVRLMSSDFCEDIMDLDTVRYIYESSVLPILDYFDNKYDDTKSMGETMHQMAKKMMQDEGITDLSPENISRYFNTEINKLCEGISNDIDSHLDLNGNDTNDPQIMDLLDATQKELSIIYHDYIIENKHHDRKAVIAHLRDVYASTSLTSQHIDQSIRSVSTAICGICNTLITIIETGGVIPIMKKAIDSSFDFINESKSLSG